VRKRESLGVITFILLACAAKRKRTGEADFISCLPVIRSTKRKKKKKNKEFSAPRVVVGLASSIKYNENSYAP
jgi:hypothetical protein